METILPTFLNDAKTVLVITVSLGILGLIAKYIPGKAGEVVRWIIDLFSANIAHKPPTA